MITDTAIAAMESASAITRHPAPRHASSAARQAAA